ncbi:MAG: desulfoferrodoxin family protein [Thermoguttaceae bacterium]
MQERYFYCSHCGNIAVKVKDAGVPLVCCGSPMKELEAGAVDASLEKHVPVVKREGDVVTVQVGETIHPSLPEHYIEWIALHTRQGVQRHALEPGAKPEARFALIAGDEVEAAYAYCNLHGLWKK